MELGRSVADAVSNSRRSNENHVVVSTGLDASVMNTSSLDSMPFSGTRIAGRLGRLRSTIAPRPAAAPVTALAALAVAAAAVSAALLAAVATVDAALAVVSAATVAAFSTVDWRLIM